MQRERSSQASSFTHDFKIWVKRSHNLTSDWAICFLCPQSSRDHLGSAFLWGHRHVVPGLCDSWALPGMAPLPRSLRVRSGNVWFELMNTHRLICCYFCMCMNENCACALSSWMWTECAWEGGTRLPEIPLTALDDSCAASLFIWTDATEPLVQLVQPLCSKARHCRVSLSLSLRWGTVGTPWTSCAPSPSPTSSSDFSQNQKLTPPHLQVSNQS